MQILRFKSLSDISQGKGLLLCSMIENRLLNWSRKDDNIRMSFDDFGWTSPLPCKNNFINPGCNNNYYFVEYEVIIDGWPIQPAKIAVNVALFYHQMLMIT